MIDLSDQHALLMTLPSRIADELRHDDRIAAVWLGGSLGRGEGDALSDIDLVVVGEAGVTEELAASLERSLPLAGRVALVHEAPQNAPLPGRQLNVLYDTDPLPLYVDWNVWPFVPTRPRDVSVLFERAPLEPHPSATFDEMLASLPLGRPFEQTRQNIDHFRVFMTPILAKHAARGWFESADRILETMSVDRPPIRSLSDVTAVVGQVLKESGEIESQMAISCIRRYLSAVLGDR